MKLQVNTSCCFFPFKVHSCWHPPSTHARLRRRHPWKARQTFRSGSLLSRVYRPAARQLHRVGAFLDDQPVWTLDQIAGLVFGGGLLACVYLAAKADVVIAKAQRRELGLCEECGGLFDKATCQERNCPLRKTR